jgi:hypothetical protein
LIFLAKINDHGGRQGNTVRIITQWRRPVASSVAMDLVHWVMYTILATIVDSGQSVIIINTEAVEIK